jgi:UDP-N-acetylglucosamine 1-carboxyvinyltransferase
VAIAGMCASGTTVVEDVRFIERGYENFVGKLNALGADIRIVDERDEYDGREKILSIMG